MRFPNRLFQQKKSVPVMEYQIYISCSERANTATAIRATYSPAVIRSAMPYHERMTINTIGIGFPSGKSRVGMVMSSFAIVDVNLTREVIAH